MLWQPRPKLSLHPAAPVENGIYSVVGEQRTSAYRFRGDGSRQTAKTVEIIMTSLQKDYVPALRRSAEIDKGLHTCPNPTSRPCPRTSPGQVTIISTGWLVLEEIDQLGQCGMDYAYMQTS